MNILKTIFAGILIGATLFFLPFFFLRFVLFFFIIGTVFRLFGRSRFRHNGYRSGFQPAFTDTIRNMSDEEYINFKQSFNHGNGFNGCGNKKESNNPQ